jgi:predicted RNase H-like nuclease (RuvC/YqgF family)
MEKFMKVDQFERRLMNMRKTIDSILQPGKAAPVKKVRKARLKRVKIEEGNDKA